MVRACCVPDCKSGQKLPSHQIPANAILRQKWIEAIHRLDLNELTPAEIGKHQVSTLHFPEEAYRAFGAKRTLIPGLCPTVNLPMVTTEGTSVETNSVLDGNIENVMQELVLDLSTHAVTSLLEPATVEPSAGEPDTVEPDAVEFAALEPDAVDIPVVRTTPPTTRKPKRRRLIDVTRRKMHTPTEEKYYKTVLSLERTLKRKEKLLEKIKKENDQLKNQPSFHRFTPDQQCFYNMIVKNLKKSPQGRRYSDEEKILALSIWKIAPRGYNYLRQIFPTLPDPRTLHEFLEKLPLLPGPNEKVVELLKDHASTISDNQDLLCTLLWDEIQLDPHLDFDVHLGRVIGVEDWGEITSHNSVDLTSTRTPKIAEHALVFMLRGVKQGWKIPLSYSFCQNATKADMLKLCIKQHLAAVIGTGFIPIATSCDQGSSNTRAITELLSESHSFRVKTGLPERPVITLLGHDIIPMYDAPHVFKCIRNNLMDKDLTVPPTVVASLAKWSVIEKAFEADAFRASGRQF